MSLWLQVKIISLVLCGEDERQSEDFVIRCDGGKVDCSHQGLEDIPGDIPTTTTHLVLSDNIITKISALGLFNRLPNLKILDMSRNKIDEVEQGAFEGAYSINEM